jgi:lysophospholipase L1-like esterase
MNPLKHFNKDTFVTSTYLNGLEKHKNQKIKVDGCEYTYNELGFRADSIYKDGIKIMTIGCSNTEGVGVNDNDTWPALLCSMIPNSVNINLGHGGRSNDYISRTLLTFYDFFQPDLVIILYTNLHRREIYTEENGVEGFIPTHTNGYFRDTANGSRKQSMLFKLQNDNEDYINWYKNHQLIKLFLESKKCNWIWDGSEQIREYYVDSNILDCDYCNMTDETDNRLIDNGTDGVHPGPKHNLQYATELHNYIMHNSLIINKL